jgi:hypothetical protein
VAKSGKVKQEEGTKWQKSIFRGFWVAGSGLIIWSDTWTSITGKSIVVLKSPETVSRKDGTVDLKWHLHGFFWSKRISYKDGASSYSTLSTHTLPIVLSLYAVFIGHKRPKLNCPSPNYLFNQSTMEWMLREHLMMIPHQSSRRTFRPKKQRLDNCLGASAFA